VTPPLLVGRDEVINMAHEALEDGPGSPYRALLLKGGRGIGKTVLLNALEDDARALGWITISETASTGMIERLTSEHLPALLKEHADAATRSHLTSLGFAHLLQGSWETTDKYIVKPGLRTLLTELTGVLARHRSGLLITLDELAPSDDLVQFVTVIQHAFREGQEVSLVGAGLPSNIDRVLAVEGLTFLQRAERQVLGPVGQDDVRRALRDPIVEHDRTISDEALQVAGQATAGYPFMIQLVGYQAWRLHPESVEISQDDAEVGASRALRRIGELVHAPTLRDRSAVERSYLVAMAADTGPSSTSKIAERLGVDANYASQYRLRLIDAGLIVEASWGKVDFALPGMRDYLRDHAVADIHVREP
jgi:hypothetical protein